MKRLCNAVLCAALICAAPAWADAPPPAADEQMEAGINPRYLLMDTRGRAVSDQDFPGRFQLIAFGYTFCPDICPTTLAEMSLIMEKLGKQAERLQPLFVSVDPERDTPELLRRYTAFFHPRIIGLTGSPELVRQVADHFKVRYEKHWEPGAEKDKYSVDHSAGMYLLGPDGSFVAKFAYATPPQETADRIRALMEEDSQRTPARRPPARKAP
jgi:protein SCO1/2